MKNVSLALVVAVASVVSGCGTPKAGDSCNQTGFLCASTTAALECKVGVWVELPCRGPTGCTRSADKISCDMKGNMQNDACASVVERKGLCTADGTGTLECQDGALKLTNTCRTCTVSGDTIVCQPQ